MRRGGHYLDYGLFGSLGGGIPYANAAKFLFPEKRVLLFSGDGSIGFNFMEFERAISKGIPIVVVRENKSVLQEYEDGDERFVFVENYMEAAGLMMAMKAGIHPSSVRRPLGPTTVISGRD